MRITKEQIEHDALDMINEIVSNVAWQEDVKGQTSFATVHYINGVLEFARALKKTLDKSSLGDEEEDCRIENIRKGLKQ